MIKTVETDRAPKAIGPYSQAKTANGFIFLSGQIPLSPETGEVVGADIACQTEQVIKNIEAVLKEAGAGFNDAVKTTCFLKDMADFPKFNEVYARYFLSNPARSTVEVAALPKGVLVEIEVIALANSGARLNL